jgi:hypothetical protein
MRVSACHLAWGARAVSPQFAAVCREHPIAPKLTFTIHPATCRVVQADSLRSPDQDIRRL